MPLVNPSFIPSDTANFYLAVFSQDMQSMIYGSCFGGGDSREHVDGGTSRFDKNGKIHGENFDGEELTSDNSKKSISSFIVNFSTSSFAHPSLTM